MQPAAQDAEWQSLVVRPAVQAQGQPPKVRCDFVRKVICFVVLQVLVGFGIASPFLFRLHVLQLAFGKCHCADLVYQGSFVAVISVVLLHFNLIGGSMQLGRQTYMRLLTRQPWNCLLLLVFALAHGILTGFVSLSVPGRTVGILGLSWLGAVVLCSAYARWTPRDCSTVNHTLALRFLIFVSGISMCFHASAGFRRVLVSWWLALFLSLLVHHTQLIFGTSRPNEQLMEYTIDMYALAAFNLFSLYASTFCLLLRGFAR